MTARLPRTTHPGRPPEPPARRGEAPKRVPSGPTPSPDGTPRRTEPGGVQPARTHNSDMSEQPNNNAPAFDTVDDQLEEAAAGTPAELNADAENVSRHVLEDRQAPGQPHHPDGTPRGTGPGGIRPALAHNRDMSEQRNDDAPAFNAVDGQVEETAAGPPTELDADTETTSRYVPGQTPRQLHHAERHDLHPSFPKANSTRSPPQPGPWGLCVACLPVGPPPHIAPGMAPPAHPPGHAAQPARRSGRPSVRPARRSSRHFGPARTPVRPALRSGPHFGPAGTSVRPVLRAAGTPVRGTPASTDPGRRNSKPQEHRAHGDIRP